MAKSVIRNSLAAVLIAGGAALSVAGAAFGAPPPPPQSGDPRAVVHAGNATTCAQAGLAGGIIAVTATVSQNTYITVTGVPTGTTVTGIVVKGAPAYNVYLPGALGSLPWPNLHPPLAGNSGKPATISHWFACGTKTSTTTTTPPTTTTTTTTTTVPTTTTTTTTKTTTSLSTTKSTTTSKKTTTTCPPTTTTTTTAPRTTTSATGTTTSTTTTAPSTTTTSTTTTTKQAAPVPVPPVNTGSQQLAFTGFNGGWLIVLALVLMLAGLSLLTVPSLLARRR
jgi:hypothetical protein